MANNQKKLKAFVRYDGSGRVVASSLILRKNKPRVGRWFEIPTYECCNGTTNTTTTQGGGGNTPTAYIVSYGNGECEACRNGETIVVYTLDNSFANGSTIYSDPACIIPFVTINNGQGLEYFIAYQELTYTTNSNGVLSLNEVFPCSACDR
jgi:hypothetical protein